LEGNGETYVTFLKILRIIYKEWLMSMDVVKFGAFSEDYRARGKPV
jgi:hypothetical protein